MCARKVVAPSGVSRELGSAAYSSFLTARALFLLWNFDWALGVLTALMDGSQMGRLSWHHFLLIFSDSDLDIARSSWEVNDIMSCSSLSHMAPNFKKDDKSCARFLFKLSIPSAGYYFSRLACMMDNVLLVHRSQS